MMLGRMEFEHVTELARFTVAEMVQLSPYIIVFFTRNEIPI